MSQGLLSIKTRQVFRGNMVGWKLREVADEFDAAQIDCHRSFQPPVMCQRSILIEQCYHSVVWDDPEQVRKVLQVLEGVVQPAELLAREEALTQESYAQREREVETLIQVLNKDGFQWAGGRIVPKAGIPSLSSIENMAAVFDAQHMADQIRRMHNAVELDPSLAIGTAKELIETCCKTILSERGKPVIGTPDVSTQTKETLKELKLIPEQVPEARRGADVIKRLLSNLGTIGYGLAELRGLYGTGHGKHASTSGLGARHARLAVGAAATLTVFLFETHGETKT